MCNPSNHLTSESEKCCINYSVFALKISPPPPQESSERLRDLTNKLEDANRKRQEVEHKLHESQNEYANLESKYRRSVEKESQLQDQISDLQSQLKNQIDAHNQTKVRVVLLFS